MIAGKVFLLIDDDRFFAKLTAAMLAPAEVVIAGDVCYERAMSQRPLAVGDRLDTDILGANNAGIDSLLVLSGVTSVAELISAPHDLRPTYVSWDASGIASRHRAVSLRGEEQSPGRDAVPGSRMHITGSTLVGAAYAAAAWYVGGMPPTTCLLAAGECSCFRARTPEAGGGVMDASFLSGGARRSGSHGAVRHPP